MSKKISAVGIKKLWYGVNSNALAPTDLVSATALKAALDKAGNDAKFKSMENIHQDTWQLEEAEASQDSYKNQLTKQIYRMSTKEPGEITVAWTIGAYDYALKKEFLGGTLIEDATTKNVVGWKRDSQPVDTHKPIVCLTEDNQYAVFPHCYISANEANTDGAIAISVKGTVMEPDETDLASEYWFDGSATPA